MIEIKGFQISRFSVFKIQRLAKHDEAFLEKITATDWHLTRDDSGDTSLQIQR